MVTINPNEPAQQADRNFNEPAQQAKRNFIEPAQQAYRNFSEPAQLAGRNFNEPAQLADRMLAPGERSEPGDPGDKKFRARKAGDSLIARRLWGRPPSPFDYIERALNHALRELCPKSPNSQSAIADG